MHGQFWVIGAEFCDLSFTCVVEGTLQVSGPYSDKNEAAQAWREYSQASRYKALTRFTIAESPEPSNSERAVSSLTLQA